MENKLGSNVRDRIVWGVHQTACCRIDNKVDRQVRYPVDNELWFRHAVFADIKKYIRRAWDKKKPT